MKILMYVCIVATAAGFYTDVDESLNMDELMSNPDKLKPYMDCYLDRGPCSKSALSLKNHFIDGLSTSCKECDNRLKHMAEEFLLNALVKYPEDMEIFKAKYDPTGVNMARFVAEVSKY